MKMFVVVALALVAAVAAAPVEEQKKVVKIVRADFVQNPDGSFESSFETEDGTKQQVTGTLKTVIDEDKKEHVVVVLRGFYSYIADDGHEETVNYEADETGYHADGPSIPKAQEA